MWSEIQSHHRFVEAVERNHRGPVRQHRPMQAIALVDDSQLVADVLPACLFTLSGLVDKFRLIDVRGSTVGSCEA